MDKITIKQMSDDIQRYLVSNNLIDVKPKDLMPMLVNNGYFTVDHREGLPLRNLLRELDRSNQLSLIPQVRAERKKQNTFWYFNPLFSDFNLRISKYLDEGQQTFSRYKSWNHCFDAFGKLKDTNLLSLHLGFYLASWGMYRGSSKLLQKDYLVHKGAVKIIKDSNHLRCSDNRQVTEKDIDNILAVILELRNNYHSILGVQPTDTLISKIILGTLGCLPAFDRYFLDGVRTKNLQFKSLSKKSLQNLFSFVELMQDDLAKLRIPALKRHYPDMKLVDMYFWQIGFDMD